MNTEYNKLEDGEGRLVNTENTTLKIACCDCGFVHYQRITIKDDKYILIGFKRDQRATAQLRRHNYGNLQQNRKQDKYKLSLIKRGLTNDNKSRSYGEEEVSNDR